MAEMERDRAKREAARDQKPSVPGPTPPDRGPEVRVAASDQDLASVIASISSQAGKTILVAPDVHENVTLQLKPLPWRDAVDLVARMTACDVAPLGSECLIVEPSPRVSFKLDRADVWTALRELAKRSGANIMVSHQCSRVVASPEIVKEPWRNALRSLLKSYGAHAVLEGSIIVVLPGPGPDLPEDAGAPWWHGPLVGPETARSVPKSGEPVVEPRFDLDFANTDLQAACDELGRESGRNVFVDPEIHERVTAAIRGATLEDALLALAVRSKCRVEWHGSVARLERIPLVSLRAKEAPVAEWLSMLGSGCGSNIVPSGALAGRITCDLHEVFCRDALEASCLAEGFELHEEDGILRISPARRIPEMPDGRARPGK